MKKNVAWALCALWMGVIFAMSALPGEVSGEQSGRLVRLVMSMLSFFMGDAAARIPIDTLHYLLRKSAHMAEYAVLFLLYHRALRLSGARRPGPAALVLSACYAATDEFHQGFIAGRGPSPVDVMIDAAGAAIAWACLRLVFLSAARIKKEYT